MFDDDGLKLLEELIVEKRLQELEEDVEEFKTSQRVIDNAEMVYASYEAAKLHADAVENLRTPLEWSPGAVKDRDQIEDERLRPYGGIRRIVHAGNWEQAWNYFLAKLEESEWVSLDLETTSSSKADEWLKANGQIVDPLDARIVSMGVTLGANQNSHLYFTVGHKETESIKNLTLDHIKQVLEAIPESKRKVVHNAAGFELPVLHKNLGKLEAA